MKKKFLLLAVMMAIVACLFALSISAAGSTSNEFAETPQTIEGIATPSKIGTNERVVMLGSDGFYYTFPAYYILNDNTSCSFKTNNSVNKVLGYADGTSHKNYVVRIEIPEGTTYINGNLLDYNTNLVYVKMPNTVTNTGVKVFQSCTNLETLILSNKLTVIQNDFCKGCSKLSSPIVIPATVTDIRGYCFDGCNNLSSITNYAENIKEIAGNAFSGCPMTEFNFPDNLTSIGQYAFNGAQFTSVDLPNTITTLGSGVFQGCTKLTFIRLPEALTQVPHDFLKGTTGSSITIVVPRGCTSIYSQYSLGNSGIKEIIFTGASTDAFVASVQEKASGWVSKIVYQNHCQAYYGGNHQASGVVQKVFLGQAFASDCKVFTECGRECGAENVIETLGKLIHTKGYATSEIPDSKAVMHSYVVDKSLISKYQEHFADLKFGILAVGENTSAPFNGSLIDAQGNKAHEKIAMVDFTEKGYDEIEIKIGGIDGYEDRELYFCGYVIGGGSVYYIENDAIKTQAETITYNDVCAILTGTGNEEENENV